MPPSVKVFGIINIYSRSIFKKKHINYGGRMKNIRMVDNKKAPV